MFRWPTCSAYSTAKSAVVKFTENVAIEAKSLNISLFSFHPGLIHSTGFVADFLDAPKPPVGSDLEKALKWGRREYKNGLTVDAESSASKIIELCDPKYKMLSGCYITVYDDLAYLLEKKTKLEIRIF